MGPLSSGSTGGLITCACPPQMADSVAAIAEPAPQGGVLEHLFPHTGSRIAVFFKEVLESHDSTVGLS